MTSSKLKRISMLGNLGIEDLIWTGDDGNLDRSEVLKRHGYGPVRALEMIVLAIIDASAPSDEVERQARKEQAIEALTGTPRKRGMNEKDDHALLIEIARRYFAAHCSDDDWNPKVAPIVRSVYDELDPTDPRRRMADRDSVVRRLSKKFAKDRDRLLVWATSDNDWDRYEEQSAIDDVLTRLGWLGIPVRGPDDGRTQ